MINKTLEIYTANNRSFEENIDELLSSIKGETGQVVRLVFFGDTENNDSYLKELLLINSKVKTKYIDIYPVVSYVAQASLCGQLALEVWQLTPDYRGIIRQTFYNNNRYLTLECESDKEIVIGGLQAGNLDAGISQQAKEVFNTLGNILNNEGAVLQDIVRQWNYIENITGFDGQYQRYQEFNDARSHFYSASDWENGYPAATGIGTKQGGVVVDANILISNNNKTQVASLNNSLQVAAHQYSKDVLLGAEDKINCQKTTPKFERAKALCNHTSGMIYISGTAAIRGEDSLRGVSAVRQAEITMENIDHLVAEENLAKENISSLGDSQLKALRVYLKNAADVDPVKQYLKETIAHIPIVYLHADICREELLIEIEGIATFEV